MALAPCGPRGAPRRFRNSEPPRRGKQRVGGGAPGQAGETHRPQRYPPHRGPCDAGRTREIGRRLVRFGRVGRCERAGGRRWSGKCEGGKRAPFRVGRLLFAELHAGTLLLRVTLLAAGYAGLLQFAERDCRGDGRCGSGSCKMAFPQLQMARISLRILIKKVTC